VSIRRESHRAQPHRSRIAAASAARLYQFGVNITSLPLVCQLTRFSTPDRPLEQPREAPQACSIGQPAGTWSGSMCCTSARYRNTSKRPDAAGPTAGRCTRRTLFGTFSASHRRVTQPSQPDSIAHITGICRVASAFRAPAALRSTSYRRLVTAREAQCTAVAWRSRDFDLGPSRAHRPPTASSPAVPPVIVPATTKQRGGRRKGRTISEAAESGCPRFGSYRPDRPAGGYSSSTGDIGRSFSIASLPSRRENPGQVVHHQLTAAVCGMQRPWQGVR
jgi:hypothetical protein